MKRTLDTLCSPRRAVFVLLAGLCANGHVAQAEPLRLAACMRGAVEESPRRHQADIAVEQSRAALRAADTPFDPLVSADMSFGDTAQRNPFFGNDLIKTRSVSGTVAYSQGFTPGTVLSGGLRQGWQQRAAVADFLEATNSFTTDVYILVEQPLLRGLGIGVNESPRLAAEAGVLAAQEMATWTRSELAVLAAQAYASLHFVHAQVRIRRQSLELAQEQDTATEAQIVSGALPEVARLEADQVIAAREEALAAAVRQLREVDHQLRAFLRLPHGSDLLEPIDPLITSTQLDAAPEDLVAEALEHNASLHALDAELAQRRIAVVRAEDGTLPRLDLSASFALNGIASAYPEAVVSVATDGNYSLGVGVTFSMPLFNDGAQAEKERQHLEARNALWRRQMQEDEVIRQVRTLAASLQDREPQLAAARLSVELAQQTLAAERERFDLGRATRLEVRIAEETIEEARLRQLTAEVAFMQDLAALHHWLGRPWQKWFA